MTTVKKVFSLFVLASVMAGCGGRSASADGGDSIIVDGGKVEKWSNGRYSTYRHGPYKFKVHNDGPIDTLYATYEQYMWEEGFPDSIIVRMTRDGKFEGYEYAYRCGVTYDEDSNYVSPEYVIGSVVGDNIVYDLKGNFVRFECTSLPHSKGPDHGFRP